MKNNKTIPNTFTISGQSVRLYPSLKMADTMAKLEKQFGFKALSQEQVGLVLANHSCINVRFHIKADTSSRTVTIYFRYELADSGYSDEHYGYLYFWVSNQGLWYPLKAHKEKAKSSLQEKPRLFRISENGTPVVDLDQEIQEYVKQADDIAETVSQLCFVKEV